VRPAARYGGYNENFRYVNCGGYLKRKWKIRLTRRASLRKFVACLLFLLFGKLIPSGLV
jgi:small neutral amino acid transporter SnatA (MarC family)